MKYTGRIVAIFPILIISYCLIRDILRDISQTHLIENIIVLTISVICTWALGHQYDKAKSKHKELLKSKEELQKNKEELQHIFDSVDAMIWSNDVTNKKIYVSKGIQKLSGYTAEQFWSDYNFWTKIIYHEDTDIGLEFFKKALDGHSSQAELRFVSSDNEILWVHILATPIFSKNRKAVVKINGVAIDIANLKKTEAMLQESEARYRNVLEIMPNLIIICYQDQIVYANPSAAKMAGVNAPSDLIGRSIFDFILPPYKQKAINRSQQILQDIGVNERVEYELVRPDGTIFNIEIMSDRINFDGRPCILVVGNDVTEKKKFQEKITYMAYHDALTNLPNRYMYNETLEEALIAAKEHNQKLAVLFIDLDRFKYINDTMGHEAGDQLLSQVAVRLTGRVRIEDTVFRLGGDEFVILLKGIDKKATHKTTNSIVKSFSAPFMIGNKAVYITPSIGISMYPEDGEDKESLNKKADIAMYVAKGKGNNYQFYLQKNDEIIKRNFKIERDMRNAIEQNEFFLLYQPKIDLRSGKMYGVEALVRWRHPKLGLIAPNEFIPVAEQTGLILPLGDWVLQQACHQNKRWRNTEINLKMSINVSPLQFEDCHFISKIHQALTKNDLPPDSLIIEITESVMQKFNKIEPILQKLKKLGFQIAIDDFGTGYSSLSVLNKLAIDYLKIDRSFVRGMVTNTNTASLVKTIIEMGRNLSFELIAEGIESLQQVEFLLQNNCYFGQGYFYSPPVSPEEIEKMWISGRGQLY